MNKELVINASFALGEAEKENPSTSSASLYTQGCQPRFNPRRRCGVSPAVGNNGYRGNFPLFYSLFA